MSGRTEYVEIEGVPFAVTLTRRGTTGLLALHADNEGGTGELAESVAERCGATSLVFRQPGVRDPVHLPSPRMAVGHCELLQAFLAHVSVTVSLHGHLRSSAPRTVFLGGRNRSAARRLAYALRTLRPEFRTVTDLGAIPVALRGLHARNPVNLTRGGGVQVELPLLARASGPLDVPPRRVADALAAGVPLLTLTARG
ncbi:MULTISPECIES: poly-gamma-glutamate hydrolase family protein [unclassified Streptomyces]|uniref:poly-gamma-glutamate hydrolase family protein n=1 Tax=unclassified Streptomyces TaxID=2593676 RepID=UPI001F03C01B|nr:MULTISPECIES: poly-gamma-glutamate hydrolase family protein [unclassified Streptomyces]MCH0565969.1 poly-gamma-glutamate hydrolase family protein [Streptomyces sp. MUM 2J]MCH0569134.1 poly-gamma-glutamate hydrolase family protein [Streptomyces sp. MUM 136J]